MKIRIEISDKIPKYLHDKIIKKCLREFCDYNKSIIGVVCGDDRVIENIKYKFSMHFNKRNILLIFILKV